MFLAKIAYDAPVPGGRENPARGSAPHDGDSEIPEPDGLISVTTSGSTAPRATDT